MESTKERVEISPGVLSKSQIHGLLDGGHITHGFTGESNIDIDASAFDLPLGKDAWLLEEGQRPATRELSHIFARSKKAELQSDPDGEESFRFEPGRIYLVKLDTFLKLPRNINGRATGKSSIGRLDVITRLLTSGGTEYDVVPSGYDGELHLLVLPQTFPIVVRPGESLNQLRLFSGPPLSCTITHREINHFGTPFWHVASSGPSRSPRSWDDTVQEATKSEISDPTLFDMTVDLADFDFKYVFKARKEEVPAIDVKKRSFYDPSDYFEQVPIHDGQGIQSLVLERDSFYIMKSKERLYIPEDVAVEVVAISERIGDIRIHYAGFAHPGFGRRSTGGPRPGTPLIFEVRATDMPTRLYDGSLLARMQLFRMSQRTPRIPSATKQPRSDYDNQELKLSNVFREWNRE